MKRIVSGIVACTMVLSLLMTGEMSVSQAAVKGKLNKTKTYIAIGKTYKLKVTNKGKAKVSFSSTKKSVAKVSAKGTVKGIKKGKATIVAKVKKGNKSKKLKCKITVVKGAKTLKILDSTGEKVTDLTLVKYTSTQLNAKISPKSSNDIVEWTSSNTDVATVDAGKITAQYVGKSTITAKTYSGKKVKVKVTVEAPEITGQLKSAYEKDFKMGVAVNTWQLAGTGSYIKAKGLITSQFNSITLENQMKPEALLSTETKNLGSNTDVTIQTEVLSQALSLAWLNGLKVRGHCLLWHSQTPDWFFYENYDTTQAYASKETMKLRMENYIRQVLQYCQQNYPGIIYAWDVVNEAVTDEGKMRTTSNWYKVYGDDSYIDDAFAFARKYADNGVSLFYNDYNEYVPVKRDKIYEIVNRIYQAGNCDGIGMQSHYTLTYPTTALVKRAIQKYNSIASGKIQIQLTELDIHTTDKSADGQTVIATKYAALMKMLLEQKRTNNMNITGVTFWGLTDANSWLTNFKGETSYPLLFSGDYTAKSAFVSVLEAAK